MLYINLVWNIICWGADFKSVLIFFVADSVRWGADSKSVLIVFVAHKVLKLWNYTYYKYLVCTNDNNANSFHQSFKKKEYNYDVTNQFDDADPNP